jgi:hypothetical protein
MGFLQNKLKELLKLNAINLEARDSKEEIEIAEQTLVALKNENNYFEHLSEKEIKNVVRGIEKDFKNTKCIITKIKNKMKFDKDIDVSFSFGTYTMRVGKLFVTISIHTATVDIDNNGKGLTFNDEHGFLSFVKKYYISQQGQNFIDAID